jgi:hypothetical protein
MWLRRGEGAHLANQENACALLGNMARARESYESALAILEAIGDPKAEQAPELLEGLGS